MTPTDHATRLNMDNHDVVLVRSPRHQGRCFKPRVHAHVRLHQLLWATVSNLDDRARVELKLTKQATIITPETKNILLSNP